jgi:hypothetical protein
MSHHQPDRAYFCGLIIHFGGYASAMSESANAHELNMQSAD